MFGRRKISSFEEAGNAPKKIKKWQLELTKDTEESNLNNSDSPLDELNNLEEIGKDIFYDQEPLEHTHAKVEAQGLSDKDHQSDEKVHLEASKPETHIENNFQKQKRYAWMDSEDEDILSSSEDDSLKEPSYLADFNVTETQSETDSTKKNQLSHLIDENEPKRDTIDKSIGPSNLTDGVNYAYVSNISWEASVSQLTDWIDKLSGHVITASHPFESTSSSINTFKQSNNSEHGGRIILELQDEQSLSDVLRLNERNFMGRPIRITKAFKRNGKFFFAQNLSKIRPGNKTNTNFSSKITRKIKSMDGGYNWAS